MDILAHSLWTNLAYYKKYRFNRKQRLWAVFFGIAPDLVSFTPATLFAFSHFGNRDYLMQLANSSYWPFAWAQYSYNYTHSLVFFAVVTAIVLAIRKGKIYWPLLGWALHIGIDIFSHKGFYETPFLYPVSNYKFSHGWSWGDPAFMFINYGLLIIIYLSLLFFLKNKQRDAKE